MAYSVDSYYRIDLGLDLLLALLFTVHLLDLKQMAAKEKELQETSKVDETNTEDRLDSNPMVQDETLVAL